jgi:hypothetical protein
MFECKDCHQPTAKYIYSEKHFECSNPECRAMYIVPQELEMCHHCGGYFFSYTWFDPSSCPHCGFSRVE